MVEISVVVPCYRSRATLAELVGRLHASLPAVVDAFELILVVDGSPDDTYPGRAGPRAATSGNHADRAATTQLRPAQRTLWLASCVLGTR